MPKTASLLVLAVGAFILLVSVGGTSWAQEGGTPYHPAEIRQLPPPPYPAFDEEMVVSPDEFPHSADPSRETRAKVLPETGGTATLSLVAGLLLAGAGLGGALYGPRTRKGR